MLLFSAMFMAAASVTSDMSINDRLFLLVLQVKLPQIKLIYVIEENIYKCVRLEITKVCVYPQRCTASLT